MSPQLKWRWLFGNIWRHVQPECLKRFLEVQTNSSRIDFEFQSTFKMFLRHRFRKLAAQMVQVASLKTMKNRGAHDVGQFLQ